MIFCLTVGSINAINNPDLKPSFANLVWYSQKDYVKRTLSTKGYAYIGENGKFSDLTFDGKINGISAFIVASFNDKNQLVKTNIIFRGLTAKSVYDSVKASLTEKYGKGRSIEIRYLPNYDSLISSYINSTDKHETTWVFPTNSYDVWLQITRPYTNKEDFYTTLSYESPAWSKELDRRNNNSDF